jgi:hypothetical protein
MEERGDGEPVPMITEYMLNMHLPPEVARSFVKEMGVFHAELNRIKRDAIAARPLHALQEHKRPRDPKLRLSDVKELFERMRDFIEGPRCAN